jgi:hypothetical protein
MGCAASRSQVEVRELPEQKALPPGAPGFGDDPILANLRAALTSKREALQLLDAEGGGDLDKTEAAWTDQLQSAITDLETVVAQRRSALANGGKHDQRQARVFSAQIAATAASDLQRWKAEGQPPAVPFATPPSAIRRKELTVLTPPAFQLPGWEDDGEPCGAEASAEELLRAARDALSAHRAQAEARAAELQALKERAAELRAASARDAAC